MASKNAGNTRPGCRFPPLHPNTKVAHITVPAGSPAGIQFAWAHRPPLGPGYVVQGFDDASVGGKAAAVGRLRQGMILVAVDGLKISGPGATEDEAREAMIAAAASTRTLTFVPPPPEPPMGPAAAAAAAGGGGGGGGLPPAAALLGGLLLPGGGGGLAPGLRRLSQELQQQAGHMLMSRSQNSLLRDKEKDSQRDLRNSHNERLSSQHGRRGSGNMVHKNLQQIASEWWNDPFSTPARRRRIYNEIAKDIFAGWIRRACRRVWRWRRDAAAATRIQARWRTHRARRWYAAARAARRRRAAAAALLARAGRGLLGRRAAARRRAAAAALRAAARRRAAAREAARRRAARAEAAAAALQRAVRGFQGRKKYNDRKQQRGKEHDSAILIQSATRGARARAAAAERRRRRRAAAALQRGWLRCERRRQLECSKYKRAAYIISHSALKWFEKTKELRMKQALQDHEHSLVALELSSLQRRRSGSISRSRKGSLAGAAAAPEVRSMEVRVRRRRRRPEMRRRRSSTTAAAAARPPPSPSSSLLPREQAGGVAGRDESSKSKGAATAREEKRGATEGGWGSSEEGGEKEEGEEEEDVIIRTVFLELTPALEAQLLGDHRRAMGRRRAALRRVEEGAADHPGGELLQINTKDEEGTFGFIVGELFNSREALLAANALAGGPSLLLPPHLAHPAAGVGAPPPAGGPAAPAPATAATGGGEGGGEGVAELLRGGGGEGARPVTAARRVVLLECGACGRRVLARGVAAEGGGRVEYMCGGGCRRPCAGLAVRTFRQQAGLDPDRGADFFGVMAQEDTTAFHEQNNLDGQEESSDDEEAQLSELVEVNGTDHEYELNIDQASLPQSNHWQRRKSSVSSSGFVVLGPDSTEPSPRAAAAAAAAALAALAGELARGAAAAATAEALGRAAAAATVQRAARRRRRARRRAAAAATVARAWRGWRARRAPGHIGRLRAHAVAIQRIARGRRARRRVRQMRRSRIIALRKFIVANSKRLSVAPTPCKFTQRGDSGKEEEESGGEGLLWAFLPVPLRAPHGCPVTARLRASQPQPPPLVAEEAGRRSSGGGGAPSPAGFLGEGPLPNREAGSRGTRGLAVAQEEEGGDRGIEVLCRGLCGPFVGAGSRAMRWDEGGGASMFSLSHSPS